MKKIVLTAAVLVAMVQISQAKEGIKGSKHDLSTTGIIYIRADAGLILGPNEICIYCHTPHNTYVKVPLWNRVNPSAGSWAFYNSPTLTPAAKGASFNADSVSLFCMSCHDGVTQLGDIRNTAGADVVKGNIISGTNGANIGGGTGVGTYGKDLTNDHPVGFSYDAAAGVDNALFSKTDANTNLGGYAQGVFYGQGANMMECASCHAVHTPNAPGEKPGTGHFLRKANVNSGLCLACHNK